MFARPVADRVDRYVRAHPLLRHSVISTPTSRPTASHGRRILWAHAGLGGLALAEGDATRAETAVRRGLVFGEQFADRPVRYVLLWTLGEVKWAQGDLIAAERLLEEALAQIRAHGDHDGIGTVLGSLGYVALSRGDFGRAPPLDGLRSVVGPAEPRTTDFLNRLASYANPPGQSQTNMERDPEIIEVPSGAQDKVERRPTTTSSSAVAAPPRLRA